MITILIRINYRAQVIKLFLMRLAYTEPEMEIAPGSCFDAQQHQVMEEYMKKLEEKPKSKK